MPSLTLNYGDNTGGTGVKMTHCVVLTTNAQSHSNIEGVIPAFSRIDNVAISLQWKTSLSLSKGDCRIYADANTGDYYSAGGQKVEPFSQASNGYTTLSVDKNNTILSTTKRLPDYFLSKSEFTGRYMGTNGLCIWFSATVARKWFWKDLKMAISYTLPTLTINLQKNGEGTVSGGGSYEYGRIATITATPASGYTFVK